MNIKLISTLLLTIILCACAKQAPENASQQAPIVGNDRDAHGCIGSAGYLWCAKTAQCERPWELAQQQGFANDAKQVEAFCSGK